MIQLKCIEKIRDKQNSIIEYKLQDINEHTKRINAKELKQMILNKKVEITNLKLTSDNKLIDKNSTKEAIESTKQTKKKTSNRNSLDKLHIELYTPDGIFLGYLSRLSKAYNKIESVKTKIEAKSYASQPTALKECEAVSIITNGAVVAKTV